MAARMEQALTAATPYLKILGGILSLAGLAVAATVIWRSDFASILLSLSPAIFFVAVAVYALANACQGFAWLTLIGMSARGHIDRSLLCVHGRCVIAKYVPGGIFQFVSRQLDLADKPISQKDVAKASAKEVLGLVVAALGIITLGAMLGSFSSLIAELGPPGPSDNVVLAMIVAWFAALLILGRLRTVSFAALALYILYFIFFELTGALLFTNLSNGSAAPDFGTLTAAWLAGYVVIGSPGGIGVREWAILALLRSEAPAALLATFIVAFRLACLLGDALYWGLTRYRPRLNIFTGTS